MNTRISILSLFTFYFLLFTLNIVGNPTSHNYTVNNNTSDTIISNLWIRVDSFDLDILPPSTGVSFYRDGIVYLSSTKLEGKIPGNHVSFGISDARYAVLDGNRITDSEIFSRDGSFVLPCEAMTFSRDYKTMYYTKYSKQFKTEKIFRARYNDGQGGRWEFDNNAMEFCSEESTYIHPALSSDGKVLVFASNCQGSLGGMDLFLSEFKNGNWSNPMNIGGPVNTPANELYPYLDSENNLYFSSDNARGYGGYDIYVCKFRKNTWEKPVNLAEQVNTEYDDVAFSISRKNGKNGFFTVMENMGRRSRQLFMVNLNESIPDTLLTLSQYFTSPEAGSTIILSLEPAIEATTERAEESRLRRISTDEDIITYRVQFMTSFNAGTRSSIFVGSTEYAVFEYLYSGAYRLCVGEYSKLTDAITMQNKMKTGNYPAASVVAFKNNVLSLDQDLLAENRTIERQVKEEPKVKEEQPEITISETKIENRKEELKEQKIRTEEEPVIKIEDTKKSDPTPITQQPTPKKDEVVYRVQILSTTESKGSYKITIADKQYDTWEYFYIGAYRTTVGEFSSLSEAIQFQKLVRAGGFPQGFVAAFINNERSTDRSLFK